jgi:hypothetical protein
VKLGLPAAAALCSFACAPTPQGALCASSFDQPSGPSSSDVPSQTAEAPPVWLNAQRDVLTIGQSPPDVSVHAGVMGLGAYNKILAFTLSNPDGSTNVAACHDAKTSDGSSGVGALSFECHDFAAVGRYVVRFDPAESGLKGPVVDVPLRFVSSLPPARSAPDGWRTLPLADRLPPSQCYSSGTPYQVTLVDDRPIIRPAQRAAAKLPLALATRLSPDHALRELVCWL